jgi:transposase
MKRQVIKQNVGVDISKDDFKVCFYQLLIDSKMKQQQRIKGSKTFKNTLPGFKNLVKWIEKHRDENVKIQITMEATGVYYEQLVHYIHQHQKDYHQSVVLPNMSKSYFKSWNTKSKTDKIDAKILGKMGLERDLDKWQPASANSRTLKQLTRDRVNLLEQRTALSNRLHALNHSFQPHKQVIKRLNQQLRLLKKQTKEVEKQIEQLIKKDDFLNEKIQNVCQIKGLGLITVATIIAETDGFNLFTSRGQLISYCGYDIVENESGSSIKGKTRISKKGNKFIRRALHFPALVVIKYDAIFRQLWDRIFERTKIKMKAYVAVQRKLLILIYTLFKKNQPYQPNFKNLNQNKKMEFQCHQAMA